jgi:hypothetical protein
MAKCGNALNAERGGYMFAMRPKVADGKKFQRGAKGADMATIKIRTNCDFPPIPIRSFDWSAWIDGREEDGPYGHGATEVEAIADLKEQIDGN